MIKKAADSIAKSDRTIILNVFNTGRMIDIKKVVADTIKKISKEV